MASLFYSGVCYTYIAQKDNAILKFDKIIKIAQKSKEAKDSLKWVNLKPLNIGIVLTNDTKLDKNELQLVVDKIFKDNKMYNLVDITDTNPPLVLLGDNTSFFKLLSDKNIQVIVYIRINDKIASDLQRASFAANKGDYATELRISVKAEAFSVKKRKLYVEIPIEERDSFINRKVNNQIESIKKAMITRGIERLIFKLIENNTF